MPAKPKRPEREVVVLESIAASLKLLATTLAQVGESLREANLRTPVPVRAGRQPVIKSISTATYDRTSQKASGEDEEVPGFRRH